MIKIKLREMAERHGIKSAYQLQTLLNIQPSVAAKWFKNDMKMIGFESLNILCKYFNCVITDILIYTPDKDARKSFRETKVSAEAKVKLDKIREMRAKVKEFIATQLNETKVSDTQTKKDVARATKMSNIKTDSIEIKDSITDNEASFDTPPENPQTDNVLLSHSLKDSVQSKDTKLRYIKFDAYTFDDIENRIPDYTSIPSISNVPDLPVLDDENDFWLSTKDVGKLTGRYMRTVRDFYKQGLIRTKTINKGSFVKLSDLVVFWKNRNK